MLSGHGPVHEMLAVVVQQAVLVLTQPGVGPVENGILFIPWPIIVNGDFTRACELIQRRDPDASVLPLKYATGIVYNAVITYSEPVVAIGVSKPGHRKLPAVITVHSPPSMDSETVFR
jgi:hypothetical protein